MGRSLRRSRDADRDDTDPELIGSREPTCRTCEIERSAAGTILDDQDGVVTTSDQCERGVRAIRLDHVDVLVPGSGAQGGSNVFGTDRHHDRSADVFHRRRDQRRPCPGSEQPVARGSLTHQRYDIDLHAFGRSEDITCESGCRRPGAGIVDDRIDRVVVTTGVVVVQSDLCNTGAASDLDHVLHGAVPPTPS